VSERPESFRPTFSLTACLRSNAALAIFKARRATGGAGIRGAHGRAVEGTGIIERDGS